MSSATVEGQTRQELQVPVPLTTTTTTTDNHTSTTTTTTTTSTTATTLYDLLHNSLILRHTVPHLPISSRLNLAATNKSFKALVFHTPGVFRHLDLRQVQSVQPNWRRVSSDDTVTEDEFYSGSLRVVFSSLGKLNVLQHVQTLILDGLCVTAELCHEVINNPAFNVRILSIRSVRCLNQGKLMQTLQYACRPSRPKGSPKLKALYVFGPMDHSAELLPLDVIGDADAWWTTKGHIISRSICKEWALCMLACQDIIAFDTVLCRGPRHRNSHSYDIKYAGADSNPSVAAFGLSACDGCGDAPEGLIYSDSGSIYTRPLLSPPPLLSSSLRAATAPKSPSSSMIGRCLDCIRERFCTVCVKWWCESCYQLPNPNTQLLFLDDNNNNNIGDTLDELIIDSEAASSSSPKIKARVSKSCWECGNNCDDCIDRTQRVCRKCCAGYCITHNEGSTMTHCDWCVSRGRGLKRF